MTVPAHEHGAPSGWYGRCQCGGVYEERSVEVRCTDRHGAPRVLTDVPQGVCPLCARRVYKVAVLQRIEGAYKESPPPVTR